MENTVNENDSSNQAVLVYSPHPLLPAANRQILFSPFHPNETIADYLTRHDIFISPKETCHLFLDGVLVPREYWYRVKPKPGHFIVIRGAVHGGGGGGKNPLATVLMIAVAVMAPMAAPAMGLAAGTMAATMVTAGIRLAGALVIGAIFAPSTPSSIRERSRSAETNSPTYAITGASNRARLYGTMPLVVGRHIIYPDLGAHPYTQFEGDEQFLYQVLHLGLSDTEISDIRIGNTPIEQYRDVTVEMSDMNGRLTLFPARVEAIAGGTLTQATGWIIRRSGADTTGLRIELAGALFSTNKETGATEPFSLTLQIQYRAVDSPVWLPFAGDQNGFVTLNNATRKTLRRSFFIAVPRGQYEIQLRQVSSDELPDNAIAQLEWVQLLSMQPDDTSYANQKRIAVRIKATGQLNGTIDTLNAIAASRILVWNGSKEVVRVTSNPGHQFIWIARGKFDESGQRLFGAGLSDDQIDLAGLREWAAWCDANSLFCNLVFDSHITVAEMLATIARCGRASPTWASGKLGVVYDSPHQPIIQLFGMVNIKEGSFSVEYLTDNLADEIIVSFVNPALDWKPDTVRVLVPGTVNPKNTVTVELLGVTSVIQAGREANLIAARQLYHRRRITWETDVEGLVCNRGDVVALAHDLTSWAVSGRLVSGTHSHLVLDRPVAFTDDTPYLQLRAPDNTIIIRQVVKSSGSTQKIDLMWPLAFSPDDDTQNHPRDYIWFFAPEPTPGKKVKITEVEPLDEQTVKITAIDEVDDYYAAEKGDFHYLPPSRYHGELASVTNIQFAEDLLNLTGLSNVHISWELIAAYGARLLISIDHAPAVDYGIITGNGYSLLAQGGQRLDVTLIPQAVVTVRTQGTIQTATYIVQGLQLPPYDVQHFTVVRQNDELHFSWAQTDEIDIDRYILKKGERWESAITIGETTEHHYEHASVASGTYLIKAVSIMGKESVHAKAVMVGAAPNANYILHKEIQPLWRGTHDHTTVISGRLELQTNGTWEELTQPWESYTSPWSTLQPIYEKGSYTIEVIDMGITINARVEISMMVEQLELGRRWEDFNEPWETYTGVWATPTPAVSVTVEIDTSGNGKEWDGFRQYVPGYFNARYYRFRLTLSTSDIIYQPIVTQFNIDMDVPDRITRMKNQAISQSGTTLKFEDYHVIPTLSITIQDGVMGDNYRLSNKTKNSITVHLYDGEVHAKAGSVDVIVMGY